MTPPGGRNNFSNSEGINSSRGGEIAGEKLQGRETVETEQNGNGRRTGEPISYIQEQTSDKCSAISAHKKKNLPEVLALYTV